MVFSLNKRVACLIDGFQGLHISFTHFLFPMESKSCIAVGEKMLFFKIIIRKCNWNVIIVENKDSTIK